MWKIGLVLISILGEIHGSPPKRGSNFRVAYTAKDYLKTQGHDVDKQMVCKEPFGPSGRTCYLVSPEKMEFKDAATFCMSAGSSLVEPSTDQKMLEIRQFLESREQQADVWVGGKKQSGKWIWATSGADIHTSFWAPNEPAGIWKWWAPKDFVKLSHTLNYQWKAESSGHELHVLCEQHDALMAAACPDGTIFRGQCYTISHEKKTWQDARQHCEKTNGEIVMVDKKPVYRFLEAKLYQIFGEPVSNTLWTYEYKVASGFWINIWKTVTRLFGAGEECSVFDRDTGEVSIVDCATSHPYVCVFEDREKFPVNCIEHEGRCYNVYSDAKPAREAQLTCQGISSQRLTIKEESEETTILNNLFLDGNGTPERGLLLDSHVEGGQARELGISRLFDKMFYLHMEKGFGLFDDCNVLNYDRGSIDSRHCYEKHYFACEYGVQDDPYAVERINQEVEALERQVRESNGAFLHKVQSVNEKEGADGLYQVDIRLTPQQEARIHGNAITPMNSRPDQFAGDITQERFNDWLSHQHRRKRRNAISSGEGKWTSGIIPYDISEDSYDSGELNLIKSAFDDLSENTCIQFVPRTEELDYLYINNTRQGCFSNVGRVGGRQILSLSSECIDQSSVGTVQHELLHALGMFHEQSRYDRDDWVQINTGNIIEEYKQEFDKIPSELMETNGVSYDYNSVMHFPLNAFAIDQSVPTIITRRETTDDIGQRKGLSISDYLEVNLLYNCQLPVNGGWGFWDDWTPCSATCGGGQKSRSRSCNRPSPSNGGRQCEGPATETETCMSEGCPSNLQEYVHLGCWNDPSLPPLLDTLEGQSSHMSEPYAVRTEAVKKCADAAAEKGYTIFALRLGGKCFAQSSEDPTLFKTLGPSDKCEDGKGSVDAIDVYRLGSGPVDGDYGPWTVFAPCSKPCGGGVRVFNRTCTNPAPSLLGKACEEPDNRTEVCNAHLCPVDGGWSDWDAWTECSSPCGTDGFASHRRYCNNPAPQYGGKDCGDSLYDGIEIKECNRVPCQPLPVLPTMKFSMEQLNGNEIEGAPTPVAIQGNVSLTSEGRSGKGLLLQGGQAIGLLQAESCLNNPELCPNGFTLAFYIKADIAHVKQRDRPTYVFTSGVESEEAETDSHLGLGIYFRKDGMLKATLRTAQKECTTDFPSSIFEDNTKFFHLAVTYKSDVCLTMYYQGIPLDNDVDGRTNENQSHRTRDSFILGGSFDVKGHRLQGTLDEVMFWNESLSNGDVYQVFSSAPHRCADCDINAECGLSSCTCNSGYDGDGITCARMVPSVIPELGNEPPFVHLSLDEDDRSEVLETIGMIDTALSFDGRRDWINTGNFSGTCLSNPVFCEEGLTVSFWMRYFGRGDRPNYVLSSAAQGKATGLDIYVEGNNMNVSVQTPTEQYTAILPVIANRWALYSLSWSHDTGLKVSVDGQITAVVTTPRSVGLEETVNTELRVAQPNNCFALNGRFVLDDLRIWLKTKSALPQEA